MIIIIRMFLYFATSQSDNEIFEKITMWWTFSPCIMSVQYTVGVQYIGGLSVHWGCSVHWGISWVHQGDIMINVGEGHWENNWICMETPVYWTSSGVLMIFPHTHHGIPPVYWTSLIALHTLAYCTDIMQGENPGGYFENFWRGVPFFGFQWQPALENLTEKTPGFRIFGQ